MKSKEGIEINSRYACYCSMNGNTYEQQLEVDKQKYPGGHMVEFVLWMEDRHVEFRNLHGFKRDDIIGGYDKEFDNWLNNLYSNEEDTK